ncbi:TetR/AcrR family transcriptional regulator [Blastococcus capsensis]|uniref:TetR/AcrR family transcriptional regulator n=1 Tax=Blastococcus capsensis TaxID=1564163 RepID=UPI002542600B|nr:helix-turn-helix domain-containing protein [Blastococcus capsensis]MDK3255293.1 helix-turn-helix domain-containing protein [Blastococcus capsensis]
MSAVKGPRAYRSPVREESARRTRRAVTAAAAELFTTRGYAATSLADVARAAGVARPTVFAAFGSKPALLQRVLDEALAGDDEPVPVADRPWFRPVWAAREPAAVLDAYAGVCTLIAERAAAAFEAVRRAADTAPEVAELWQTLQHNRVRGARMVLEHLVTTGALRAGLSFERAVDVLWLLNDPAHHAALVGSRDWSPDDYRGWLADQMQRALLDR